MEKRESFFRRVFNSVKGRLNRPVGGGANPSPGPAAQAAKQTPPQPAAQETEQPPVRATAEDVSQVFDAPADTAPRSAKRQLWGQEFDTTGEGLAEDQVLKFVNSFMSNYRALEEQQQHFLSLGTLSEKAAIEADRAAVAIRARARSEAEAEAARMIAEANQKSQEMLAEAKATAQGETWSQVEGIIVAARRKAAIIQTAAKQQTQIFLIRSREALEGDLRHEVKEAYNHLLFSLQELLRDGNELEAQWKTRTLELGKRETYELEGREASPSALAAEIPPSLGEERE